MKISYQPGVYFFEDKNILFGFTDTKFTGLAVEKDIEKIASLLSIKFKKIVYLNQIHSSKVVLIKTKPRIYKADGLLTQEKLNFLVIRTADCLPLFFYDLKKSILGLIHLGWKPAYYGIIQNFLNLIKKLNFERDSSYLLIGPGLRPCCFEVKKDFLGFNFFKRFIFKREGRFFLDLVNFSKVSFLKENFKKEHILDTRFCSYCYKNFFSFRRDNTEKRTLSFIIQR